MEYKWPKYIVVDKLGWPVTSIIGRPITSFLRKLIHGRGIITRKSWLEFERQRNKMTYGMGGAAYSPTTTRSTTESAANVK